MLADALLSALLNVVVLAGVPFLAYAGWHRIRHRRGLGESARRAGLQLGVPRYLGYSAVFAAAFAAVLMTILPLEPFTRPHSPQRGFIGLGLGPLAIALALLYGVIKTGFAEEFLFRGLIAGSLGRRLRLPWANLLQAAIFLLPHLMLLRTMPELWWLLPVVFVGALVKGWIRIRSGSMFGPWLIHATMNVATCLMVTVRTAA